MPKHKQAVRERSALLCSDAAGIDELIDANRQTFQMAVRTVVHNCVFLRVAQSDIRKEAAGAETVAGSVDLILKLCVVESIVVSAGAQQGFININA